MASFEIEEDVRPPARIKVIGIGGGGSNAVDGMMASGLQNVDFHVLNTDIQALSQAKCTNRLQIGGEVTQGLGAGGDPLTGEKAANAAKDQIREILEGTDMVFLTAGLGGGTGTGATPVIAQMAKEAGVLTVSIVTRPFSFEGPQRLLKADQGVEKLREYVDTLIVVSNDRLLEVVGNKATLVEAFQVTNNVLAQGVQSISDLISVPGLINLDFADVRAIMGERGGAVMGVGQGKGENRAEEAVKKACSSPLLDKIEIDGATGVLICITGPTDLRLSEINTATALVYKAAEENANIIFGAVIDEHLQDEMRVTIIATGFADDLRRTKRAQDGTERLTSPKSSVSLRAKLESMLSGQASDSQANDSVDETSQAIEELQEEIPPESQSQMPPPPQFPDTPPPDQRTPLPDPIPPAGATPNPSATPRPRTPMPQDPNRTPPPAAVSGTDQIDFERISMEARQEIAGEQTEPEPEADGGPDLETPSFYRKNRKDLFE